MQVDIIYGDTTLDHITTTKDITYATNDKRCNANLTIQAIDDGVDPSDATATAADILSPKTAYIADGSKATGTIATKTDSDITSSGGVVTIPAGYYAQQYTKQGDPSGDATLTSGSQMLYGVTAYSQGTKYTGTISTITQATPTATKGSVSNNTIYITPSCTEGTGYINGTTKTGTAVSVTASELVSGTVTETANGTFDVSNYQYVTVALPAYTDLS